MTKPAPGGRRSYSYVHVDRWKRRFKPLSRRWRRRAEKHRWQRERYNDG